MELKPDQRCGAACCRTVAAGDCDSRAGAGQSADEESLERDSESNLAASEGNPFMVVETLRALEEGTQPRRSGILLP